MKDKSISAVAILLVASLLTIAVTFYKTIIVSDIDIQYPEGSEDTYAEPS